MKDNKQNQSKQNILFSVEANVLSTNAAVLDKKTEPPRVKYPT